jgi:hypothetical protein
MLTLLLFKKDLLCLLLPWDEAGGRVHCLESDLTDGAELKIRSSYPEFALCFEIIKGRNTVDGTLRGS